MGHVAPIASDIANIMFETCTDALDTGIIVFSKSDHIINASKNAGSFFRISDEFLKPGTSLRAMLIALFEIGVATASSPTFANPGLSRDRWVSERIAAMWHERGEHEARIGRDRVLALTTRRLASGLGILMVRDVSAHRRMEDRWRSDLERIATTEGILDNLPSMLFVLDRNLNYVAVNKSYGRFQGLAPENLIDRPLADVLRHEEAERHAAEIREVLASGKPCSSRESVVWNGEQVHLLTQRFRLGNPGNYMVVTVHQPLEPVVDAAAIAPEASGPGEVLAEPDRLFDIFDRPRETMQQTGASTVIVLSSDQRFGDVLTEALRAFRFDACTAASRDEAWDILQAARDLGLTVDLIMFDDADLEAAALVPLGSQLLSISRARPVHFAVAEAAAAVTHHSRSVSVEIDTDYLPEFPEPGHVADPAGFEVDLLVVEDNPVNQEVYAQILGGLGIAYELAKDGAEAVRLWDILRPSLVLMDLGLPDMDGCEAAARIRQAEASDMRRTSIIGVMPRLSHEMHEKCLSAGMDETIVKPLSVETIEALYERHILTQLDRHQALMAGG